MKVLLGMLVIDRPKTTEKCIQHIINHTNLDDIIWVVIDNNSNQETKDILEKYSNYFAHIIHNDFNIGTAFGVNQYLQFRVPEQHALNVNVDAHILVDDWLPTMLSILELDPIGTVSGRRPTFWYDTPQRIEMMRNNLEWGIINNVFIEWPITNQIIFPFTFIKGSILDKIGYMNEATCMDDLDFVARVTALRKKNVYLPDIVILQPQDEEQYHLEYKANREVINKRYPEFVNDVSLYSKGEALFRGTRFKPETMTFEYQQKSDENWEWFRNYKEKNE